MRFTFEASLPVLARTPGVVRAMLSGLPDTWTTPNYGPNTWSAKEIVAHLIFGERTDWIPRLRIALQHRESRPFDPFDRAGHKDILQSHTLAELLALFERERAASLEALSATKLTEADLDRTARHPALGVVTIRNLLAAWVVHDLNHLAQIAKAMAFQFKHETGPWEQYLSVLAPPNPR